MIFAKGIETSESSVRDCLSSLGQLLFPRYAVVPVTEEIIECQPWTISCALICFPEGLKYCESLHGPGQSQIREYVEKGGLFLGFCTKGCYGKSLDDQNPQHNVRDPREMAFFPSSCLDASCPGHVHDRNLGTKALSVNAGKDFVSREATSENISFW